MTESAPRRLVGRGADRRSGDRSRRRRECWRLHRTVWLYFVMTEVRRCRWCRGVLPGRGGRGRPREFCSPRCRQWDWVARQRARELRVSEDELLVARASLDELHDELYVLACAVDDTERDLAAVGPTPTAEELRQVLDWLLEAARPLRTRELPAPQ